MHFPWRRDLSDECSIPTNIFKIYTKKTLITRRSSTKNKKFLKLMKYNYKKNSDPGNFEKTFISNIVYNTHQDGSTSVTGFKIPSIRLYKIVLHANMSVRLSHRGILKKSHILNRNSLTIKPATLVSNKRKPVTKSKLVAKQDLSAGQDLIENPKTVAKLKSVTVLDNPEPKSKAMKISRRRSQAAIDVKKPDQDYCYGNISANVQKDHNYLINVYDLGDNNNDHLTSISTAVDFEACIDAMAVKKHGLVTNSYKPLDLQALAQYIQLMNEQPGYLPPVSDLVKNCQDIVKCLARSRGKEERRWEMLQAIEEYLLRVVNTVDDLTRTAIVNGIIDKFYSYISDPQSDADAATSLVLVVIDSTSVESLMSTTRWMVQQGEDGPASGGLRASLTCVYTWICEVNGQATNVLGDLVMSFIKALEEKEYFDVLMKESVDNVDRLFCALERPAHLRQSIADVIFHVLASLRQSAEAFDKIASHVRRVLTSLASDSGQFSRQLLQNVVDIITASVDYHLKKYRGQARVAFKDKYGEVTLCLERHMASRGCELLKITPWPDLTDCTTMEPVTSSPSTTTDRKIGLMNLGNTCYMNSVVQALLVTRRFSTHVMVHMARHPYWAVIAMLFGRLTHSVADKLQCREFYAQIRPPFFTTNQQHDSFEFLGYMFELLQAAEHLSDENYDYSKPPVLATLNKARAAALATLSSTSNSDSDSDVPGSNRRSISPRPGGSGGSCSSKRASSSSSSGEPSRKRARLEHTTIRRDCFISSIFGGVLLTRIQCNKCKTVSCSRDMFRDLPLAFPEKNDKNAALDLTLQNGSGQTQDMLSARTCRPSPRKGIEHNVQAMLDYFCSKEHLTGENRYLCRDCGVLRDAERSVVIESLPPYLLLVLKNFKFEPKLQVQSKLIHNMYYNQSLKVPSVRTDINSSYSLYAAVVHSGFTLDSGHYYTLAKDGGTWYKFNDDQVTRASENLINELDRASTPYLLFYRRDDCEEASAPAFEDLPHKIQEHIQAHNKHYMDSLRP